RGAVGGGGRQAPAERGGGRGAEVVERVVPAPDVAAEELLGVLGGGRPPGGQGGRRGLRRPARLLLADQDVVVPAPRGVGERLGGDDEPLSAARVPFEQRRHRQRRGPGGARGPHLHLVAEADAGPARVLRAQGDAPAGVDGGQVPAHLAQV